MYTRVLPTVAATSMSMRATGQVVLPTHISLVGITAVPLITYGVDGEGRPYSVSASSGQSPLTSTTYNPASQVTSLLYGSGDSDTFLFDPNTDREISYQYQVNGQSVVGSLTWNANGSLGSLAITDPFNTANSQVCTYAHDDLGRTWSTDSVAPGTQTQLWQQTFNFDTFGNVSKTGTSSFAVGYSSSTNQINSGTSYGYDTNGNLTSIASDGSHVYTWDSDGNLFKVDGIQNTFDALDRAVEQLNGSTYTQVLYGPGGTKLALMNGGISGTLTKAFVPLPGGATAVYNSSGLAYYRHPDWLGSSRFASTTTSPTAVYYSGAYAPYGESYSEYTPGGTDRSFTGQNQDTEPGQYDFLYRGYSPVQGRWISPDPAGPAAVMPGNPQSWNRYAYVMNRPLSSVDALGLYHSVPIYGGNTSGGANATDPGYDADFGDNDGSGFAFGYGMDSGFGIGPGSGFGLLGGGNGSGEGDIDDSSACLPGDPICISVNVRAPYLNQGPNSGGVGFGGSSPNNSTQPYTNSPQQCEQAYSNCVASANSSLTSCQKFRGFLTYGAIEVTGTAGGFLLGGPAGAYAGYQLAELPAAAGGGLAAASCFPGQTSALQSCASQKISCLVAK